jgi:NOL1/NOP2/fmu family ribosome biogenesis protein
MSAFNAALRAGIEERNNAVEVQEQDAGEFLHGEIEEVCGT